MSCKHIKQSFRLYLRGVKLFYSNIRSSKMRMASECTQLAQRCVNIHLIFATRRSCKYRVCEMSPVWHKPLHHASLFPHATSQFFAIRLMNTHLRICGLKSSQSLNLPLNILLGLNGICQKGLLLSFMAYGHLARHSLTRIYYGCDYLRPPILTSFKIH